ncbi:MAG: pyrroline-5-carboxylate reductase [Bacteroidota bacterium]
MNILIIGGGNMGLTYAQSFLRSHICSTEQMMILEKSEDKAVVLAQKNIGTVYGKPEDCIPGADLIILAVKPQDSAILFETIKPIVDQQQVFLSIMAGVQLKSIADALGVEKIIRAMPNLPAQLGQGMTVFTSTDSVTRIELVTVQNLLNTTGKTIYVDQEQAIDAATAISGSGPAYVWYFMNAMMEAAQKMGFSYSESELLVHQTMLGAIELYAASDLDAPTWIQRVASKGGTTEAALASFKKTDLHEAIVKGANAALERAKVLSKQI